MHCEICGKYTKRRRHKEVILCKPCKKKLKTDHLYFVYNLLSKKAELTFSFKDMLLKAYKDQEFGILSIKSNHNRAFFPSYYPTKLGKLTMDDLKLGVRIEAKRLRNKWAEGKLGKTTPLNVREIPKSKKIIRNTNRMFPSLIDITKPFPLPFGIKPHDNKGWKFIHEPTGDNNPPW